MKQNQLSPVAIPKSDLDQTPITEANEWNEHKDKVYQYGRVS